MAHVCNQNDRTRALVSHQSWERSTRSNGTAPRGRACQRQVQGSVGPSVSRPRLRGFKSQLCHLGAEQPGASYPCPAPAASPGPPLPHPSIGGHKALTWQGCPVGGKHLDVAWQSRGGRGAKGNTGNIGPVSYFKTSIVFGSSSIFLHLIFRRPLRQNIMSLDDGAFWRPLNFCT